MPPDPASRPSTALGTPEDAHAALDAALAPGSDAAYPVEVNVSRLTDELRARGVMIASGRGERPAHYGRPAAAERARHGAAPFGTGSRVRTVDGAPTDVPPGLDGEVRQVFKCNGMWLADVQWRNGGASEAMSCEWLEVADEQAAAPAVAQAVREMVGEAEADAEAANQRFARQLFGDVVPSVSARKARGEKRPAWWGEPPAEGTRRKLIGDVLRAEDVLSESEIREFADAIELALVEADRPRSEAARLFYGYDPLDEPPLRIVLADLGDGGGGPGDLRFVEVEDRNGKTVDLPIIRSSTRPFYEIVLPAPVDVAEDLGDGLSEGTGQRIARALETLTTSAGGALRELLDRTATDREAR